MTEPHYCPFCRGPATVMVQDVRPCNVEGWTDAYTVWCNDTTKCGARQVALKKSREEAVASWNERKYATVDHVHTHNVLQAQEIDKLKFKIRDLEGRLFLIRKQANVEDSDEQR